MMKKFSSRVQSFFTQIEFRKRDVWDFALILFGALIQAFALRLFLIPAQLVSGGISGLAQLLNHFTAFPIGMMVLLGNIPLFILGWQYLGGPRFAIRTILSILAFSIFTDVLVFFLPAQGVTNDLVLNTIYGGLVLGIGLGVVYRGRGTSGGSDILGRILNRRFNMTISQAYLITDSLVVLGAGFVFGWTKALYGLVLIYVSGLAAETALQGTNVIRSAMIVTTQTEAIAQAIMSDLERGVTILSGTGAYTGQPRNVIYCAVSRMEINRLKILVHDIDPKAFMVIGHAQEALGEGFSPLKLEDQ
jgi:uncharacterized membrane-anchored protein YitT (DUF2179 family)